MTDSIAASDSDGKAVPKDGATNKRESAGPSPMITFEKELHDFGEIDPGSKNKCEFKFTNTGRGVLKILEVKSTCGCTAATPDKTEYAPGESGTIKVTYNASKQGGTAKKHIYVSSNDPKNPKVKLIIKARIVLKVRCEPESLRLVAKEENAGCPKITLTSVDNKEFSIKSIRSRDNCITADFDPSVKATRFVLQPKVDMEKLNKISQGRMNINLTHPKCSRVDVNFLVQKRFSMSPTRLGLHSMTPGNPQRRKISVTNNYGEDFEIESVSSKKGYIKVLSREKDKDSLGNTRYRFDVEINAPAAKENKMRFTDYFVVQVKDGKKLEVQCSGFYKKKRKEPKQDR